MSGRPTVRRSDLWECDFAVLAVQDRELAAVLRLVEDVVPVPAADGTMFYRFTVATPPWHRRERLTGLVWPAQDVGRVAAAVATARLLAETRTGLLFLVGVAGGFAKNDVGLGDVVVATSIIDYEMQRLSPQGTEFRLKTFRVPDDMVAAACSALDDMDDAAAVDRANVRFGAVLSGDKVIASDDIAASLLELGSDAVAVEMEGAGVAAALQGTATQSGFVMIRGIVDLANESKREQAREWADQACDAVAAFMLATAYRATDGQITSA